MKTLIIAEKNSVAASIAKAVGATQDMKDYFEGNNTFVSWSDGHLIKLADPKKYNAQYQNWNIDSLPVLPQNGQWKFEIIGQEKRKEEEKKEGKKLPLTKSEWRLSVIEKLMKRDDVNTIIEATDPGREGEVIFRLIYNFLREKVYNESKGKIDLYKKEVKRLWAKSVEVSALKKEIQNCKPLKEYDNLWESGFARMTGDWILGINGTRLYSETIHVFEKGSTSVGRVMTPTLAMITEREKEIRSFKKINLWVIEKNLNENCKVETKKYDSEDEVKRDYMKCKDSSFTVTEIIEERKKTDPPKLYSLTDIQEDANKRFGFTAAETLNIIQELYMKGILTYPRTDSNYITHEDVDNVTGLFRKLLPSFVGKFSITESIFKNINRLVKDEEVSDHTAILITESYLNGNADLKKINENSKKILQLVVARMLLSVSEEYIYDEITVSGTSGEVEFSGKGKRVKQEGYRDLEKELLGRKEKQTNDFPVDIQKEKTYECTGSEIKKRDTQPQKHYTENTLLKDMENAGCKEKKAQDGSNTVQIKFDSDVERKGLGTSATRAETIEKLVRCGYIKRDNQGGKLKVPNLIPTDAAYTVIEKVSPKFKDVATTVEWENELIQVGKGKADVRRFNEEILRQINVIVEEGKNKIVKVEIGPCPWCGHQISGDKRNLLVCPNCQKKIYRHCALFDKNENLDDDELSLLLKGKSVKKKLFFSKTNNVKECRIEIDFEKTKQGNTLSYKIVN